MSEAWNKLVAALVGVWHWAHDWYALVVVGAALIGVVVVIVEIREMKRHSKTHRHG